MTHGFVTILLAATASVSMLAPVHAQMPSQPQTVSRAATTAGNYERVTVHGASLVGNLAGDSADRMVSVYLPPGYSKDTKRRYPVLYLLHGFTDSDSRWFGLQGKHFVNVPSAADRAFANGVREMILVMPDAFTKYQGSMYSNSVVTGDWEAFVAKDLVAYVDQHYRTLPSRASRGLAGHSMGGYGTLRIGMKSPAVFSSLYSLSPCCMGANMEPDPAMMERAAQVKTVADIAAADFFTKAMLASAAAWSPNPANPPHYFDLPVVAGKRVPETIAAWAANAPLTMVHQYIPALKSFDAIAVDAGDRDAGIADTVKTLDQMLTAYGIRHSSEIYAGDHVNRIEQRLETQVLPFFAEALKFK